MLWIFSLALLEKDLRFASAKFSSSSIYGLFHGIHIRHNGTLSKVQRWDGRDTIVLLKFWSDVVGDEDRSFFFVLIFNCYSDTFRRGYYLRRKLRFKPHQVFFCIFLVLRHLNQDVQTFLELTVGWSVGGLNFYTFASWNQVPDFWTDLISVTRHFYYLNNAESEKWSSDWNRRGNKDLLDLAPRVWAIQTDGHRRQTSFYTGVRARIRQSKGYEV